MGLPVWLLQGQNLPQNLSLIYSPFVLHAARRLSPSFLCHSSLSSGEEPLPLDVGSAFDLLPRQLERRAILRGTGTPAPLTDSSCPVSGWQLWQQAPPGPPPRELTATPHPGPPLALLGLLAAVGTAADVVLSVFAKYSFPRNSDKTFSETFPGQPRPLGQPW